MGIFRRGFALLLTVVFSVFSVATVKIGVLLPFTGGLAAAGDLVKKGIELAHEEKSTALGEKIELVFMDTRSEKTESANGIARLIDKEGVVAVIGEIMSGNSLAAGEIAEKRKVPMVSPASTNPLVTQGKKFVSRVCFIDPLQGTALAEFAVKTLKIKKATVLTDVEQDYSVGLSNYFIERFKKYGGQVQQLQYKSGDSEFSAQLSQALAFGAEAIVVTGYYNEIALVAQQARSLGFKGHILAGDGANAPELIKIGGQAVEGVYFSDHYHPDAPVTQVSKKFVEAFVKKYGVKPSTLSALGYDAYMLIVSAIERAKTTKPELIATAIRSIKNFQGATGAISIDKEGNAQKEIVILKVKNGDFVYSGKLNTNVLK
ncbi:MAG: ABC transporter substrate-binding protein [Fervidobacterium sp.]|uniref:Amino acid/amide ABC transporter substrate-binding protein, HAAT family (TC 3.A.1.4.-) n=1 Tax=Fervidobacterium gondwanense DSM 13020 TaxID=1121883 RepID=A0A1M7SLQ9_FERGO|nr:ABC transporter substrate-binding protein [Fervidobacterium gondwanense]UXF01497.1 branched-chain amino acid ABC transporter substrate-binding protein [Fervidobacterium riparium]SHN59370.1 amino acid/amide ABC transporter substrate-binding protein, HAAT family (TC 3.A.1.4.-) [Fervidobacterium gondwanense DSM 13020]